MSSDSEVSIEIESDAERVFKKMLKEKIQAIDLDNDINKVIWSITVTRRSMDGLIKKQRESSKG